MADKVQSRGLTRRLTQVALSVSVLTGSGWGIYQYQVEDQTSQAIASEGQTDIGRKDSTPSDQRKHSAADELKTLLRSDSTPSNKHTVRSAPGPDKLVAESMPAAGNRYERYNRYASEKSLSQNSSQSMRLSGNSRQNPFSAVPPVVSSADQPVSGQTLPVDDRYASAAGLLHAPIASAAVDPSPEAPSPEALTPAVSTPTSSAPDPATAISTGVLGPPEVTRGQEPGNPLRVKAPLPADSPFSSEDQPLVAAPPIPSTEEQAPSSAEAAHEPLPVAKSVTQTGPTQLDVNATLNRARPLVPAVAALPVDRYQPDPSPENIHSQADTPQAPAPAKSLRQPSTPYAMVADVPRSESPTLTPGLTSRIGTGQPGERLLEGLQNPSITIEKLVPSEIQVGKKCTFAIRVQNTGQRLAQNVTIHDEVPKGTELLGTAPRAMVNGSNLVWELGPLSAGEERIVEMELIPTEEGELGSVATVMFATQASAKTLSTRPELAMHISCGKPKVLAGDQQQLQIEISNPGSGDATGVILLATLPAGVSHPAGPALELEVGTLPAGESRRFDLTLGAEQAGPIENVMIVRADANLHIQAVCEFEVIAAQLQVKVKGPEKRFLERPATYQVSVENPGTAPAKDVQLVTHLPKGLQFVKANNMGEYHAATHSVHWSLPELPANQQGTVELVTLPIEAGTQTLQIDTQASQGLADHTEKQVRVEGLAALKFEVVDTEDPIEVGGESVYEIRLTNQGSKSAANVQVVAKLPAGLRAISAEGETGHTIAGDRVEFAPLARLDPKAIVIYRISVQGIQPGHQRIQVQITTDEIVQPITKEESTRVYSDQ